MKPILCAIVIACGLLAAPAAFAGIDIYVNLGAPQPVVVTPPPVVYYRVVEPHWRARHGVRPWHYAHPHHGRHPDFRRGHGRH